MALHKNISYSDNHIVHSFVYATAVARNAASGLVSTDIGKVALQQDDNSFWVLTNHSPVSWSEITNTTAGSIDSINVSFPLGSTGGADPTLSLAFDPEGSVISGSFGLKVGILATDAEHGNRGGSNLHITASTSVHGFMSSTDKTKLDTVEANADQTTWAKVRNALGGQAGANANYVFKSDGLGSGSMVKNTQEITSVYTVGKGGDVQYTSIKTAVSAAMVRQASFPDEDQMVLVSPGDYTENNPIILPNAITVASNSPPGSQPVRIFPTNLDADLIQMTADLGGASSLINITLTGITGSNAYCIRVSGSSADITNILMENASNGLIAEDGALVIFSDVSFQITNPFQGATTGYLIKDASTAVGRDLVVTVPPQIMGWAPSNPLQNGVLIQGGSAVQTSVFQIICPSVDGTAKGIFVDEDSSFVGTGGNFFACTSASVVGPNGSSTLGLSSVRFQLNDNNITVQSANATVFARVTVDDYKLTQVASGTISGLFQNTTTKESTTIGNSVYRFDSTRQVTISDFYHDNQGSGIILDGDFNSAKVTSGSNLTININSGSGWIRRANPEDVERVSWASSSLNVSASATTYVYVNQTTEAVTSSTSAPSDSDILLGTIVSGPSHIKFVHRNVQDITTIENKLYKYFNDTHPKLLKTGLGISIGSTPRTINLDAGSYYIALLEVPIAERNDARFRNYYGVSAATEITGVLNLDITNYDLSGTLTAMSTSYYRSDTVFVTSDNQLSVIYGTAQYPSQSLAAAAAPASAPSFIDASGFRLASLVIKEATGSVEVVDRRASLATTSGSSISGGGSGEGGGVTDHGLLTGLSDDDHTQYLLVNGSRNMGGNLNLGANNITNVGLVDGVDVSSHASRHNPGGSDALSFGAPITLQIGDTNFSGSAASFSLSDHRHAVPAGTAVSVSSSNAAGSAATFSRSDHIHSHGIQTDGTFHAVVIANGASGFMSGSDKSKLDGIEAGATNTALTTLTASFASAGTGSVGTSGSVARADHKHQILIGTPSTIGTSNASGSALTLALSDHVHSHGSQTDGTLHATAISGSTAGFMSGADKAKLDTLPYYRQSFFNELTTDTTTTSTTFVSVLSQSITTTASGSIIMHMTAGASNTNNNTDVFFRLQLDGATLRSVSERVTPAGTSHACAIVYKSNNVSIGSHTVTVQWRVSANTGRIRPVTVPDQEHLSLLVEEVSR